jgi:hypothetical protein
MNESRFMELLAAYGANLARWPDDVRGDVDAFLEVAPHRVRDVWESERSFDHLLLLERDSPASIELEAQIIAASPDRRKVASSMRMADLWDVPKWLAGGALAASLALGFAVGYAEPEHAPVTDYAKMLTLSGGGAGSVFLSAMTETGE